MINKFLTLVLIVVVCSGAAVIKVRPLSSGGAENGTTWADAYLTLAAGVAASTAGDTILCAGGEVLSSTVSMTTLLTLIGSADTLPAAVKSYYQLDGNSSVANALTSTAAGVVIRGFEFTGTTSSALTFTGSATEVTNFYCHDSYAAIAGPSTNCTVTGFTITNMSGTNAVYNLGSPAFMSDGVFNGCVVGLYNYNSTGIVCVNVKFLNCTEAGFKCYSSTLLGRLINCTIDGCGIGMYASSSSTARCYMINTRITNCTTPILCINSSAKNVSLFGNTNPITGEIRVIPDTLMNSTLFIDQGSDDGLDANKDVKIGAFGRNIRVW